MCHYNAHSILLLYKYAEKINRQLHARMIDVIIFCVLYTFLIYLLTRCVKQHQDMAIDPVEVVKLQLKVIQVNINTFLNNQDMLYMIS